MKDWIRVIRWQENQAISKALVVAVLVRLEGSIRKQIGGMLIAK